MTAARRRPKCQTCGSVDRGIRGRVGRGMFWCRDEWHQVTPKIRAALTEAAS